MAKLLSLLLCLGLIYYCRLSNAAAVEVKSMESINDPVSRDVRQTSVLYNILVSANRENYFVYLDPAIQQLIFNPPIISVREPRSNYATIFALQPGTDGRSVIRNYIVPQAGPTIRRTGPTTYRIILQLTNDAVEFEIRTCRNRNNLQSICGTGSEGETICWVPVGVNSQDPHRRLVKAERLGKNSAEACVFLLSPIPRSVPPPL